jgi:hypothetical protein
VILWIGTATLCLVLAARLIQLPWRAIGLGLIAAPNLLCVVTGQSGILVSAMLIVTFGMAETNPLLSGMAAALLIIKPQFGLLIPVCYLAQRNWRATAIAAISLAGLCLLTTFCFGVNIWEPKQHMASAQNMLTAPWPSEFQLEMITPLVFFRSLHADLTLALILQCATSLAAAFACWHLWRRSVLKVAKTTSGLVLSKYYDSEGREFESLRARQNPPLPLKSFLPSLSCWRARFGVFTWMLAVTVRLAVERPRRIFHEPNRAVNRPPEAVFQPRQKTPFGPAWPQHLGHQCRLA